VASRGISATGIVADNCPIGLNIVTQNITSADADMWWRFDARVADLTVRNASNWSIRTNGNGSATSVVAGLHIANIKVTTGGSNGNVGFSALRDSYIGALVMDTSWGATVAFYGSDALYTGAITAMPANSVIVDKIDVRGGKVLLQDFNGLQCGSIRCTDSPASGVEFVQLINAEIGSVRVVRAHRSNTGTSRAVMFNKVNHVDVTQLVVDHDANFGGTWRSLEIGGGTATNKAADGLRIEKLVYKNTINQAAVSNTSVQGGADGPVNYYARVLYFNGGEGSPIWRTQTLGTLYTF
jgi:hypothetical protein